MAVDFGKDTSCTDSLRTGRMVTGARLVGEACYRRLTTPRGMLRGGPDEANYGDDLSQMVGAEARELANWPGRIQTELKKDERIESVDVKIILVAIKPNWEANVTIVAHTSAGPFLLVLGVSAVTVELLKLTEEIPG